MAEDHNSSDDDDLLVMSTSSHIESTVESSDNAEEPIAEPSTVVPTIEGDEAEAKGRGQEDLVVTDKEGTLKSDPSTLQDDAPEKKEEEQPRDGSSPRQHPIEIVLKPLPSHFKEEYDPIQPSDTIWTVLDKVSSNPEDAWYKVEFDDGRVDQLAFDEVYQHSNGAKALQVFHSRRGHRDDEGPAMGFGNRPKQRKGQGDSDFESDLSAIDVDNAEKNGAEEAGDEDDQDLRPVVKRRKTGKLTDFFGKASSGRPTRHSSRLTSTGADNSRSTRQKETQFSVGRRLRSRAARNTQATRQDDDMDELAGEHPRNTNASDSDDFLYVQSDVVPVKKRRKRAVRARTSAREASIEFEVVRRSSRANKTTRNMKDGHGDDDMLYADDDKAPAAAKVMGMKEVFQSVENPEFRDVHTPNCDACGGVGPSSNKGQLIHCQGCSLSYHKVCLGYRSVRDHLATKVGPDNFVLQCRYCVGIYKKKDPQSPNLDQCQGCHQPGVSCAAFSPKNTAKQEERIRVDNNGVDPITNVSPDLINKGDNVLFRCLSCRRAYHFEHLPALRYMDVDSDDIRADRLAEYSIDWKCRDCREMDEKVQTLVAWRPLNKETYEPGATCLDLVEDAKEYLVKWDNKSYTHCAWKPGPWVWGVTNAVMRSAFPKRNNGDNLLPKFTKEEAIPEEYLMADIILNVTWKRHTHASTKEMDMQRISQVDKINVKFQGLDYEEVVWDSRPSPDSGPLWDAFQMAYSEYLNGKYFKSQNFRLIQDRVKQYRSEKFKQLEEQPEGLRRGKLMEYQVEGLNWLLFNFHQEQNVILADEMGLGKTVQIVALITQLVQNDPSCWPFLVVVPNSTCPNWRREIKQWAPELRVVTYHGGRKPQDLAYTHELFPNGSKDMKAHVVVMSYDSATDDQTRDRFKGVHWAGLIVDEGQRLKNDQNLLYGALRAMKIPFRVLLTGTPLQNNKRELFNLLQFIDSSQSAAQLDEQYAEITAENLPELHDLIRPYFLRRTKAQVLTFLPPMAQIILPVTMSVVQEKLCKSIMTKRPELIRAIFAASKMKASERGSLNNILMQLRKNLCHPFVFSGAIEDKTVGPKKMYRSLIEASSKLVLLELMLPKLKERGHRVLIFSQFLDQLDIIEDFLTGLGYPYERLDGQISSLEKQRRIDSFNAPDSELFAFLLSTRAGGVGINLATADTVIILDPDFNPHQDIQALSRAHRIGQKRKVLCFQLMTKNSVEEKIMQIGRKKMALDHALIESMDADDDAGTDLESILKHGAEALFSDDAKEKITYDSAAVDKLLDRSQIENTRTDAEHSVESQFSFARVWENDKGALADNIGVVEDAGTLNPGVWENILKEREEEARREAALNTETLGRGGRRRQKVDYKRPAYEFGDEGAGSDESGRDADFVDKDGGKESEEEEEEVDEEGNVIPKPAMPVPAAPTHVAAADMEPGSRKPKGKKTAQGAAKPTPVNPQVVEKAPAGRSTSAVPPHGHPSRQTQQTPQPPGRIAINAPQLPQQNVPPLSSQAPSGTSTAILSSSTNHWTAGFTPEQVREFENGREFLEQAGFRSPTMSADQGALWGGRVVELASRQATQPAFMYPGAPPSTVGPAPRPQQPYPVGNIPVLARNGPPIPNNIPPHQNNVPDGSARASNDNNCFGRYPCMYCKKLHDLETELPCLHAHPKINLRLQIDRLGTSEKAKALKDRLREKLRQLSLEEGGQK